MIRTITLAVAALVLIAAAVLSQAPAPARPPPPLRRPQRRQRRPARRPRPAPPQLAAMPLRHRARPGTAGATASTAPAAAVPTMGTRASWLSDRRPLRVGDILDGDRRGVRVRQ